LGILSRVEGGTGESCAGAFGHKKETTTENVKACSRRGGARRANGERSLCDRKALRKLRKHQWMIKAGEGDAAHKALQGENSSRGESFQASRKQRY